MYGAKGAQPVITLPIKRLGTMIQKLNRGNPGPVQLNAANMHLANLELCQPAQDNTGTSARQVHSRASTCSTKNRHMGPRQFRQRPCQLDAINKSALRWSSMYA